MWCPGDVGGTNIDGTPAVDPETGIMYVASQKGCSSRIMVPGEERDERILLPTGTTISKYAVGSSAGGTTVSGLPLWKPPYSRITAIDMNTGEHLWWIPTGETPDRYKENPAVAGVDLGDTGTGRQAAQIATPSMLMYSGELADETGAVFAVDKATGETLGHAEVPSNIRYGMMTYMHEGRQYVVVQMTGGLAALALPD